MAGHDASQSLRTNCDADIVFQVTHICHGEAIDGTLQHEVVEAVSCKLNKCTHCTMSIDVLDDTLCSKMVSKSAHICIGCLKGRSGCF